ncbi:quinone oxidoreductase [Klebsiella pneumoniae]|uniref:NADPH:quinone reductase n=1 Tax=Klebsiella pneumoniae TaxID=573 RepID=A0A377XI50_KLEPN|nr:quinone oxidoreductase [Klebsiella pneumoniae]
MATRIEFFETRGTGVLQAVEFTPRDPAEHEIQVENKAIGINYIDTYVRSGLYPAAVAAERPGAPRRPGIVSKVGHGVTHIKVGDRVVYAQSALGAYSTVHNVLADKAAVLPDAISFEQAAASFLKGLTVWYLLRKTYEIKPDEMFLFHAAAGGVGLIACQWAKALGAKLIGTVGSSQKAQRAKEAGAWQVINYREESIVERLKALTDGKKVAVVYDSVGKDTWEASLDCLQRRGLMASFGNSSGPVTGVNLGILNQKGSLYVTRPSLQGYITNWEELEEACSGIGFR